MPLGALRCIFHKDVALDVGVRILLRSPEVHSDQEAALIPSCLHTATTQAVQAAEA